MPVLDPLSPFHVKENGFITFHKVIWNRFGWSLFQFIPWTAKIEFEMDAAPKFLHDQYFRFFWVWIFVFYQFPHVIILGVLFLYFDFLMDFSIPNMFVSFDPYPLDKEFLTSRSPDILYRLVLLARAISFSDHWFICVALARSIHTSRIRSATSFIQLTQQNPLQSDACSAPGKIPWDSLSKQVTFVC